MGALSPRIYVSLHYRALLGIRRVRFRSIHGHDDSAEFVRDCFGPRFWGVGCRNHPGGDCCLQAPMGMAEEFTTEAQRHRGEADGVTQGSATAQTSAFPSATWERGNEGTRKTMVLRQRLTAGAARGGGAPEKGGGYCRYYIRRHESASSTAPEAFNACAGVLLDHNWLARNVVAWRGCRCGVAGV